MRVVWSYVVVVAIVSTLASTSARGEGMAGMHAKKHVGGKVCFARHTHTGSADRLPSQRAAKRAAIKDWSSFTAWEYGRSWASWRAAWGKDTSCEQWKGRWSCVVTAYPCRSGKARRARRWR